MDNRTVTLIKQWPSHAKNMTQMNAEIEAVPERSYSRTWTEIEDMLHQAVLTQQNWKGQFETCKQFNDREGMKDAARNFKALEGVVKTLKWTLGEQGIRNPLS